jgi:hypothetical protein
MEVSGVFAGAEETPSGTGAHSRVLRAPAHDVFVSYSARDKPVADAIVSRLEQEGVRCWVAPRDVIPGTVWADAIVQGIDTSRLMVVVLSGEANESRQVIREVERAVANDVVVVPFRIESVEPTGAMAYYLASEHWLDAMTPPLESHIARLVTVAHALLETAPPSAGVAPAVAAPEPPARRRVWPLWLVAGLIAAAALALGAFAASRITGQDGQVAKSVPTTSKPAAAAGCRVARLAGLTPAAAKQRLRASGCAAGSVRYAYSSSVRRGRVATQSPRAGNRLKKGGKVAFVVSRGPRPAPQPAAQSPSGGTPAPSVGTTPAPSTGGSAPQTEQCPGGRCPQPPTEQCPGGRCPGE